MIRNPRDSRRFFRYGELPLVILALLRRSPMHGYELKAKLSLLFGPQYKASPGSVYPALSALTSEGLIEPRVQGSSTQYRVTRAGDKALAGRLDKLGEIERRTGVFLGNSASVVEEANRLVALARSLNGRVDASAVLAILQGARDQLECLIRQEKTRGDE